MARSVRLAPLVLAALTTPLAVHAALPASRALVAAVPGEVLVRFKSEAPITGTSKSAATGDGIAASAVKSRLGLVRKASLLDGRIEKLALPGYLRVEDAVAQLAADPAVLWAEPNYRKFRHEAIPNDARFGDQWYLKNTGQPDDAGPGTNGADMALSFAWDANDDGTADRTDASGIKLAVIDDGFQLDHPDLAGNFIPGRDFKQDGAVDDDPSAGREDTHGTLVSGSAGAVGNNGRGIAAPAWRVQLLPVRFDYTTETEVRALAYAREQGARVVNLSFGGPLFSNAERDALEALRDADVLVVASAGNLDSNTDLAQAAYPANYDLANIVAVAASDRRDLLADFTQYGPTKVDLAAPGVRVLTTAVGSGFATVSGTSFSSPYTASVAALIRANRPAADFREVKARLIEGAKRVNATGDTTVAGRLDADASLDLAERPSLVIQSLVFSDAGTGDGDRAPDPGEAAEIEVTFENLWGPSAPLSVNLRSVSGTFVPSGAAQTLPPLARAGTAVLRFPVTVAAGAALHEIVDLRFELTGGGYNAERHFNLEVGKLTAGVVTNAAFSTNARDEFHTYQFDLPDNTVGYASLVVRSEAGRDIDLLVKRGSPAAYEISLGVDPETGEQTFYADVPGGQIGGSEGGNENVSIENPLAGTWFVTVVNYTQTANQPYTLQYTTTPRTTAASSSGGGSSASSSSSGGGGGGGGGALPGELLVVLAALAGVAGMRRRQRRGTTTHSGFA